MSQFRAPIYLDLDLLVPLADYHDIEVMVNVDVSQRNRGSSSRRLEGRVALPVPGSPSIGGGRNRDEESEVTESRTIADTPTSALNRLLDKLEKDDAVNTDASSSIGKRSVVDFDGDWSVSPMTDTGALLAAFFRMFASNPAAFTSGASGQAAEDVPPEVFQILAPGDNRANGPIVLNYEPSGDGEPNIVALLSSDHLIGGHTIDDLDGERNVFGVVDALVEPGRGYSLERFLLSGIPRSLRRTINADELLRTMPSLLRSDASPSLVLDGPLIVIKVVAVY